MLVDDHPMWRHTLRKVLEHNRLGEIVAEASDGAEAVEAAKKVAPDVVIMDIELLPEVRVLVLSASETR